MTRTEGKVKNFFYDSLNSQKKVGKISPDDLDELVINYKSGKSNELFGVILGQVLLNTNLLERKNNYVKESWLPFADEEDYEQMLQIGLVMAINKFDPTIGHFINFCFRYCDGRMSDLNRRSYNGGRSIGNTKTIDKNNPNQLEAISKKIHTNTIEDYEISNIECVEKVYFRNEIQRILKATLSDFQMKVISLSLMDGYTTKQISEKLGVSVNKINYQKTVAFDTLRRRHPEIKDYLISVIETDRDMIITQKDNND